jgi:hypothetical protein
MDSDTLCTVTDRGTYYSFVRTDATRRDNNGVVIYPGGYVDAKAYAKVARNLCVLGQDAFLLKGDGVAIIQSNPNKALDPIVGNPGIAKWAVGGHSLGGVLGSIFIMNNPGMADGLILLGSEPAGDVSNLPVKAITIIATNDCVQTPDESLEALPLLPAGTEVVTINGGNHAGYGNYGAQAGDCAATITESSQKSGFKYELRDFMQSL